MSKGTSEKQKKNQLVSSGDISLFCSQVVLILKSAIPLQEGIGAIGENIETDSGKKLIRRIAEELGQNRSFQDALSETGAFPDYMVNMVGIGEKAGRLDSVMDSLSHYYAQEDQLRHRVHGAVVYPLILVLMMAAVISIMVMKALPVFHDVFLEMGGEISAASMAMIGAGTTIGWAALVIVLILAVLLAAVLLLNRTEAGSQGLLRFAARFGPTRRLSEKVASARFASLMSMTLASGYDTDEALKMIPSVIPSETVSRKIQQTRRNVEAGNSFAKALDAAQMFPGIYSSMIRLGAEAGRLDAVMKRLAEIYTDDAENSINRAVAVIEPVMVALLSVVIGAILLAVMLPLMGALSSIG